MKLFGMEEKQDNLIWVDYVAFVDSIIYDNLLFTVGISIGYLAENMDASNNLSPLFESRLELIDPELVFVPSLNPKDPNGFNFLLNCLVTDILQMSGIIPRLIPESDTTYESLITNHYDIKEMRTEILKGVENVIKEAADYCRNFERYSYLWLEDREECMELFLEFGRILDPDEVELLINKDPAAPTQAAPTIEAFRDQIDNYEALYLEIEKIEPFQVFAAWFQVDVRPFRQSLLNIVRKWGNMFKDHLVGRVTTSLTDLGDFIRRADEGLLVTIKEGDYNGLVNIMAYLMHVKERALTTDEMFEPMKETIDLLKYYDMDIPEEVNVLLQELPEQWSNTKKIALTVKQQVAPLQAIEVVTIRSRIALFDAHTTLFRDVFKYYDFFRYDCPDPFALLDKISSDLMRLEKEMRDIQESGSLFEVTVPEFKLLKQCRKELKLLKVIFLVHVCRKMCLRFFLHHTATVGLCLHRKNMHRGLETDTLA